MKKLLHRALPMLFVGLASSHRAFCFKRRRVVLLVLSVLSSYGVSAQIYVSSSGNNANDGKTEANAKATLEAAISVIGSETVPYIKLGTGTFAIGIVNVPENVRVVGNGAGLTILEVSGSRIGLQSGSSLSNLTVTRTAPTSAGGTPTISVATYSGSTAITIKNVRFVGNRTAIYLQGSNHIITDNEFENNRTGLVIDPQGTPSVTGLVLERNRFYRNRSYGAIFLGPSDNASMSNSVSARIAHNDFIENLAGAVEINANNSASAISFIGNYFDQTNNAILSQRTNGQFTVDDHDSFSSYPYNFVDDNGATAPNYPNAVAGANTSGILVTGSLGAATPNGYSYKNPLISSTAPNFSSYVFIQDAINYSNSGSIIQLTEGTYDGRVIVNKAVTIQGASNTTSVLRVSATVPGTETAAIIKVLSSGVTIKDLKFEVDLARVHTAIITSDLVSNLTIKSNNFEATRGAAGDFAYGWRNAIAINPNIPAIPGLTHVNVPNGSCANITIEDNKITGTFSAQNGVADAFFRAGIQLDRIDGYVVKGNTFDASVNHDIVTRFLVGSNNAFIQNNTFKGGGLEVSSSTNANASLTIEDNVFNGAYSKLNKWAMLRLRINNNARPVIVRNNQFLDQKIAATVEDFKEVLFEGNTFTPGVANFRLLTFNTKAATTGPGSPLQEIGAKLHSNTFNGFVGSTTGAALTFANFDNSSTNYLNGSFEIGAVGKPNIFNNDIPNFIAINSSNNVQTDNATFKSTYEEFDATYPVTTTGYWQKNIIANVNRFYVAGQLRYPQLLNSAQMIELDGRIFDKKDNSNIGEVLYYFPITNVNTNAGYPTLQTAINSSDTQNGHVINVDEGTYTLTDAVTITKGITLQGNSNLTVKPIINGVGNATNKALIEIDAPNVTIKNFEFQIAQDLNGMIGIASTTTDNFNNLTIADNVFKGMKPYATGMTWTSYAMRLGRGSAGVTGVVLNNAINVVRNTVTYNNLVAPEFFGRGIYAFNTYGKIGGSNVDKNTIIAAYALQGGELGGGVGNNFEFSHNDVPLGIVSAVGAEPGSHKINNNNIGYGVANLTQANGIVRMLEIKGNRTANANIEVANNLVQNYANIGVFIQRSDDVTIKNNTLTPFAGATLFNSIVFSTKEGTSALQSPVTLENLTITGNTFNGSGANLGTGIAFWNHNGSGTIKPLINAKLGGSDADKNTFSADLANYIVLDPTPSGANTGTALMGTLYDITQVGFSDRITNIFPFNGDVDASYNVFGAINTGTETDFDNLVNVKTKITDGIDDALTGYVSIQPQKAFIGATAIVGNALTVVPEDFTLVLKNTSAVYFNLGNRIVTKAFTFKIDNNAAGEIMFGDLTLNALNKQVTFANPVKVNENFTLTEGKLNASAGATLDASKTISFNFAKPGNFINGKVKLSKVKVGRNPKILIGKGGSIGTGVTFSDVTGANDTEFDVEYFASAYSNTTSFNTAVLGLIHDKEYWSVSRTGDAETKLEFTTFDYLNSGFTSFATSDATVARFNSGSNEWVDAANSAFTVNGNAGGITTNLNANFGVFTFAKTPLAVLSVKLSSFTAHSTTSGALVKWSTSQEENNARFEIEKSFDGKNFFVIERRNGQGNSTTVASYEFLDLNFKQSAYYRLVQVDVDGKKTTYADLTKFVRGFDDAFSVTAYPNPVTTKLYVTVGSAGKEDVKVLLMDLTGKALKVKSSDGVQPIELDVAGIATGAYILQVVKESGNVSKKILKL